MKRFFIMTLIISMFALAGCTTTTDGTTTADSENTSQENTNQNDQNTENENKNEENDTPAQPTLTGSTLDSITIKTLPAKTEYTAGETFDPAGLTLTANYTDTYSDQSTKPSAKDLAYADIQNDLTFTGTDFAAAGTATVTVTYKGKNATFDVTIKEPPAPLTNVTITDIDSYKIPDNFADNGNIHLDLTGEISLLKISDIAKAFPNATITADDKISYTINGGTERGIIDDRCDRILNNEFKDLTAFAIDGKISIDETTDVNTNENDKPTKIRTITVGDNITLNITGKYLDIGRNRFEVTNNAVVNLSDDIEITTYNSEVMDGNHTYITSDIANTQFDALGLTTPNFDLAISDENLYNFAHDILDRYDGFADDDEKHKLETSTEYIDGTVAGNLYDGDTLRDDAPSVKFSSIELCTTLIVGNTKITGTKNISCETLSIDFSNVVFTEDASGMHTTGSFYGISHFMGNPMQGVSNPDGYVKVDYVDTNVGEIFGDIIDLTDLSDDIMYDIGSNRNMILGGAADVIGIFRDEKQQVAAENIRKKGSSIGFVPAYLQDNPEHKNEFIHTLEWWEKEYNSSKKL